MSRLVTESSDALRIRNLEKRVEAIERRNPASISGGDGTRIRWRAGLQDDGKYGLRVWDAAGVLVLDQTA